MHILITGSNGQLGTALTQQLTDHQLTQADLPEGDITHREKFFELMAAAQPDLVIHCAAMTDVNGCALNPPLAYKINGLGTQNVALACQKFGAAMVHISSNEVFAGNRPDGYEEWMPLDPINPYGRSKAAAEFYVRTLLPRHYIVRFAWLFAPGGHNFVHAIIKRAQEQGEVAVVTDEVGNPTYVHDLAQAIAQLIETEQYGTYHLVDNQSCSRWAFANEILRLTNLSHVPNRPILSSEFKRPSTPPPYAALKNVAANAIGISLRPWQEGLAAFIQQL